MKHQTKILIGVAVVAVAGILYYRHNKAKNALNGSSASGSSAAPMTDANASNMNGDRYVVGGYNAAKGGTWVFREGNTGDGYFVPGRINAAKGSVFTPAN